MKSIDKTFGSVNELQFLPAFARFLYTGKLEEFCQKLIEITHSLDIPLMKYFKDMPEEELWRITKESAEEMLTHLAENRAGDFIEKAMIRWKTNHLPVVDRDAIVAEDLTLVNYMRKKTLLFFTTAYTQELDAILDLVNEIDFFLTESITAGTNTYITLLQERIGEHAHFIQKVNETIPGAVYVFDTKNYRGVYSNNKLAAVIGYDQSELNAMGPDVIPKLVHPADQQTLQQQVELMKTANDSETHVCKYRIRTKSGEYKWLASYDSVFKRAEDGTVSETIGITLNIDSEQQAIAEKQRLIKSLSRSEALYKKAEQIANMGNWVWYVKKNKLEWTDQLYHIYGLVPQAEEVSIERFLSFVHPDDREFVQVGVDELTRERDLDYTFRIITADGTQKWLRSLAHVIRDRDGNVSTIVGSEQDVTEKQRLISKLEESQRLYRRAQELAHLGNFSWDISSGSVFWSDEVYNIYEKPFGEPVRFEDAVTPIVEEHKAKVQQAINAVIEKKEGQTVNYAIRTPSGQMKYLTLHTDVQLNDQGEVACVVGTAQDVTEKEELIAQLQESEKLYKQSQSLAHLGNWTYDIQTGEVTWSDELYVIYERDKASRPTTEEWFSYIPEDERGRIDESFEQTIKSDKPLDITHSIVLQNGKRKVLHRKGEVIRDREGKVLRVTGTTQDVTEHFNVQSELRGSQNFIQKITDSTPSIIATYNAVTGKYTYISEGLTKLLGYPTKEGYEAGIDFFVKLIHPDDLAQTMEKNAKAIEAASKDGQRSSGVVEFDYRIKHKDGSWRWLHTYGTVFNFANDGTVEHVLNISLDVTEQIQATQKIKEQEHFIQQIADASPTILYLFDVPTQRFAYINREAFFVLGYLPDQIVEEDSNVTSFLYHPEDIPLLPCRRQSNKTFQQVDSMIQYECRMKHKDGEYRWLLVREIVFKTNEAGEIIEIIGAALDINRRKEMERTILQNTLQLEQSNASLEEFAYVASHDLKEPLRKISTFGDRLVASQLDRLTDDGKIYLRKIVDASQRMQNMISDLLSISMISGNRSFERCSLQKILEETVQTLEYKIESQQAIVRYVQLPEASIIPSQFRQLFQNLLSNSLKFVREGVQPVISISCELLDGNEVVHYQLAKADQYLRLRFADNGIGFENEYAHKIFAIFQRLHGRSEYEGSGIGLAICKKIVEHHGGVIFAEGKPNLGATFTIILPA